MATTRIGNWDYIDMEDIRCPKCGSRDFKWVNVGSHSNGDTWRCTCMKCDHEYTVVEECFFRIEEDE